MSKKTFSQEPLVGEENAWVREQKDRAEFRARMFASVLGFLKKVVEVQKALSGAWVVIGILVFTFRDQLVAVLEALVVWLGQ